MSKMEKNISFQVFFLLRRQKSRQTPEKSGRKSEFPFPNHSVPCREIRSAPLCKDGITIISLPAILYKTVSGC